MATIGLPLTGAGDATAQVAVDLVGGEAYQRMKLHDGEDGSTLPIRARGTTPGSTDGGMVTRPIASTAYNQAVVGAVGLTSGSSQVGITSGSSAVELTSAGSTRLAGRFTVENPTTSVSLSSQHTVTVGNPTTAVTVSSGVVLGAGSTANTIGAIAQGAPAPSSDNAWWVRSVTTGTAAGGSTTVDANLSSAGSTRLVGLVEGVPFTTGGVTRSTVNSSVDAALFAANANRKGIAIANGSTGTALLVSLNSTAVVSSVGSYTFQIPALGFVYMGGQVGALPNFTGLARCKMNSTLVAGPVFVTEYTS